MRSQRFIEWYTGIFLYIRLKSNIARKYRYQFECMSLYIIVFKNTSNHNVYHSFLPSFSTYRKWCYAIFPVLKISLCVVPYNVHPVPASPLSGLYGHRDCSGEQRCDRAVQVHSGEHRGESPQQHIQQSGDRHICVYIYREREGETLVNQLQKYECKYI